MTALFLFPGEIVCGFAGLKPNSDDRQILRMFVNTLVWSAVGVASVLIIAFCTATD
jgi:hypothetical protein